MGEEMPTGADNEVWSYGDEAYNVMKKYLFLRERLRPYIKEQMALTASEGVPVMRPLFYDFPQDEATWEVDDAYMFGPDLLIAPVIQKGATSRCVYLPKGARWTNAITNEKYNGGVAIEVDTPIDVIPVFLKDGAALPIS